MQMKLGWGRSSCILVLLPLVLLRNKYQGIFLLEKAGKSACMEQEKALANVKLANKSKKKKKRSLWKLGSKTSGCPCTARLLWDVMRPTRHMGVFRRGWV